MSNLSIENLSRVVSTGDTEQLMGAIASPEAATPGENAGTFSEILRKTVNEVNNDQVQADTAIKEMVAGRSKNIHETMLAVERADTSLKLMMQVRNKVLDAYKEIMRMQV